MKQSEKFNFKFLILWHPCGTPISEIGFSSGHFVTSILTENSQGFIDERLQVNVVGDQNTVLEV